MATNFILSLVFILVLGTMMIFSSVNRRYYAMIFLNILKTALPIGTAIANFGTVQFVVVQYWQYVQHTFKSICNKDW